MTTFLTLIIHDGHTNAEDIKQMLEPFDNVRVYSETETHRTAVVNVNGNPSSFTLPMDENEVEGIVDEDGFVTVTFDTEWRGNLFDTTGNIYAEELEALYHEAFDFGEPYDDCVGVLAIDPDNGRIVVAYTNGFPQFAKA